jgi:hypothetical protein
MVWCGIQRDQGMVWCGIQRDLGMVCIKADACHAFYNTSDNSIAHLRRLSQLKPNVFLSCIFTVPQIPIRLRLPGLF